jgi:hypothetical protein
MGHECLSFENNETHVECGWSGISREECENISKNKLGIPCCFNSKLFYPNKHCHPARDTFHPVFTPETCTSWIAAFATTSVLLVFILLFACC